MVSPCGGHTPGADRRSTGAREEETRISLCIFFLSLQDKKFCYKFKYRLTSAPRCTCRQKSHIRLVLRLCWGNGRDVGTCARGEGFAVSLARSFPPAPGTRIDPGLSLQPQAQGSTHVALPEPTLLKCTSGFKSLSQRNSQPKTILRTQAGVSTSSWCFHS